MIRNAAILLTLGFSLAACSDGSQAGGDVRAASIPFVTFGNIRDWSADGTRGIYIESAGGRWYYATFMAPCIQLPFAETIGFRTTPPLPLDKFDSILVRGERCSFKTFDEAPGLPRNMPHHGH